MTQAHATRKKAYVETYGCQMNISDGELMQGVLVAAGYDIVARPDDADVVLVNTCAIREHAEQRVIGRVGELYRLKTVRPDLVIGVTGCMAQRLGNRLLERAGYVDLVMGPDGYRSLPEILSQLRPTTAGESSAPRNVRRELPVITHVASVHTSKSSNDRLAVLEFHEDENYEGLEVRRTSQVNAWVPVQRGCDYRCTYCIVPYVRGNEKNRAPEHVLDEVRAIAATGITEVSLLGQTVNSWNHGDWTFPRLLREVARIDGIRRVRFTSPHPNDFTAELVEVMANEPHVCKQLHLPVQSGHDRTLKRMLRRYTVDEYRAKIRMVRAAIPEIALSTDVIVAFPGETAGEYEATLDLMREMRYDDAFLYKYSPREGTPATRLPAEQFIAADIAQARLAHLIDVHREIQAEINTAELGRTIEVLVEREAKSNGDMLGRGDNNKVVAFPGTMDLLNRYIHVQLTSTTGATFRGVRVDADHISRVA